MEREAMIGESKALESALGTLESAIEGLRAATTMVHHELEEAADRVTKPNTRRAEEQLHIALNAALGAQRSLRRRLDLGREVASRHGRGVDSGPRSRP
jgi:hypothetical protein